MPSLQQHASAFGLVVSLLIPLACGGDNATAPPKPAAVALLSSPTLSGSAGESLTVPIVVEVTASSGADIAGVVVTFASAANSGTVAQGSVTTGDDGRASTTWTLGTTVGTNIDTLRASVNQLPDAPVIVTASVTPASLSSLTVLSGDGQPGTAGVQLAEPLVVIARDRFDNPIADVAIAWTVDGGGTLSASTSTTDSAGKASVTWTLGTGTNQVHATATGSSSASATFHASFMSSGNVVVTDVAPGTLVEGHSAVLTGKGFSTTLADDGVFIDGVAASITAGSATSLTITVPTFDCRPARDVDVRVVVSGDNSQAVSRPFIPAAPTFSLAVGQEAILDDPAAFCLQFGASSGSEQYLLGVQSTSEVVSSLTPVLLTSTSAATTVAMVQPPPLARLASFAPRNSARGLLSSDRARRWARHRQAEARLRDWERQHVDALVERDALRAPAAARRVSALAVQADVAVDDTITVRVPDADGDVCASFTTITTVARAVGTHGVWLEDTANPASGYTTADFQHLSDLLDNSIYDTDVSYFGTPDDMDSNERIVVVISEAVNRFKNILGFVTDADLAPECASSNGGEFFYGVAPDSAGTLALGAYPRSQAIKDAPFLIAHELSHIIQFSVRLRRGAPNLATWTAEGQATLAEEVVGNAIEARSPGQNYGLGIAFNLDDTTTVDWYSDRFGDLATFYGFRGGNFGKVLGAPQECTWLAQPPTNPGPCLGGRAVYGVPWSLLRWISDQFGPSFPGGEQGLQRALVDNDAVGYANITSVIGVPIDTLLAQWAAMLYVDDRVPGADPKLTLPSWNLVDIYEGTFDDIQLFPTTRLIPRAHAFATFTDAFNVRAASTAYILLDGTAGRSATAVRARTSTDSELPAIMQLFVVRLK